MGIRIITQKDEAYARSYLSTIISGISNNDIFEINEGVDNLLEFSKDNMQFLGNVVDYAIKQAKDVYDVDASWNQESIETLYSWCNNRRPFVMPAFEEVAEKICLAANKFSTKNAPVKDSSPEDLSTEKIELVGDTTHDEM